ncbi:MAG: hypothetical protein AB1626_02370 [Candidatus Micrarchaeota archaeon]
MAFKKSSYFDVVFNPVETMRREKKHADFGAGIVRLAAFGAVVGAVLGLFAAAGVALLGAVAATLFPLAFLLVGVGVVAALFLVVALAVGLAVAVLVANTLRTAVLFVAAKLLGGSGRFSQHFYFNALILTTYPIIAVIAFAVSLVLLFIPVLGPAIFAVSFACIILYCVYLHALAVKETHALGWGKSVLAVLFVPLVVLVFLTLAGIAALAG